MEGERLTAQQEAVMQSGLQGRNVFFTGSAGTGKTWLLRRLVKKLREKHTEPGAVVVVSATGVSGAVSQIESSLICFEKRFLSDSLLLSALALNATTLHSFGKCLFLQGYDTVDAAEKA